jgi:60 kDa SS-A/Ro ribonucleoprotein
MSRVGLLTAMSDAENTVVEKLTNVEVLRKARIHPIAVLSALRVYSLGFSLRSQAPHAYLWRNHNQPKEWQPTRRIIDALDEAFYLAFQNVQPANKRVMLALDVSSSMTSGVVAGVPGLTPRDGSAAMAMVTARTEPRYVMTAFSTQMVPFNVSKRQRLDDVIKAMDAMPFGGTDCAQPMIYALENKLQIDTFVVYTDSETWAGKSHPAQALWQYREKTGIPAQLVVVAMLGNKFTIADPNDAGMLDVVGFDAATPGLISEFARGEI